MSNFKSDLKLYTAQTVRDIDAMAMRPILEGGLGINGHTLMQRAAQFALDALLTHCPEASGVTIVCGKGNNAGDGYLLGLLAHRMGISVQLIAVASKHALTADALAACERAEAQGLVLEDATASIRHPIVVDALLGTGFHGAPRPDIGKAINAINHSMAFVLSLDLPSGLHADTGAAELAVKADVTVTFIARKIGLYTGRGAELSGVRLFSDLGLSQKLIDAFPSMPLRYWQHNLLPQVPVDAYKHQRGHVLIVGGASGMGGAVVLAAEAALASGAGLVSVASHPDNMSGMLARLPEAMWVNPLGSDDRSLSAVLASADVMVLGPGLGRGEWSRRVLDATARFSGPVVIDADGLYWLGEQKARRQFGMAAKPRFLTPHDGEAAHLLTCSSSAIRGDRRQAVINMAMQFDATCLLKGPGTIIGTGQTQAICGHGNPGMATAGMGDVLAGLAGSLLAQQLEDMTSAFYAAVLLHSAAADRAARQIGVRGLTASAVIPHISGLLQKVS